MVDPDYPPFFVDGAEDAVPPGPQARKSGDPDGNDSGGRGSSASWPTVSQSAATPTGSSRRKAQAAARFLMRHVADNRGLTASQAAGNSSLTYCSRVA